MGYEIKRLGSRLATHVFEVNGAIALKNYTAQVDGNRITITSANNAALSILECDVTEVDIDGTVYDNAVDAQAALKSIIYNDLPIVVLTIEEKQKLLLKVAENHPDAKKLFYCDGSVFDLGPAINTLLESGDIIDKVAVHKLHTTTSINTSTPLQNLTQNGKTVVIRNEINDIEVLIDSDVRAIYLKSGLGIVTFTSSMIMYVNGVLKTEFKLEGKIGDKVTVTVDDGKAYLTTCSGSNNEELPFITLVTRSRSSAWGNAGFFNNAYVTITKKGVTQPRFLSISPTVDLSYNTSHEEITISIEKDVNILSFLNLIVIRLNIGNNITLTDLDCSGNQLTELDLSNNITLTDLDCSVNQLTELDLSNNINLTELVCADSQLTELNLRKNTNLTKLVCPVNKLVELDLSKNINLTELDCRVNKLVELDLSNNINLTKFDCRGNQLLQIIKINANQDTSTWLKPSSASYQII